MNLNFASVWEMISDLIPDNDALICGEEVVSWQDYDLRSSKLATALVECWVITKLQSRSLSK